MSETTALAVMEQDEKPKDSALALMSQAQNVADVCRQIVLATAMEIGGRRYLRVEGWASIAAAWGCTPSVVEVEELEHGVRAVAELRRANGTVVAQAEGFCGL